MSKIGKLSWYYHRLRAMPPAEIAHRLGEQVKRAIDRRRNRNSAVRFPIAGKLATIRTLRTKVREEVLKDAHGMISSGTVTLLGTPTEIDFRAGSSPQFWTHDPVSAQPWAPPGTFCFDVPYRHATGKGDIKLTWERNRLQYLQPVSLLGASDPTLAAFCISELRRWFAANPPYTGVNWCSGIEVAMRIATVAFVTAQLQDRLIQQDREWLAGFVATHATWLQRYPSLYSSANNHRTSEALGELLASKMLPELPGSLEMGIAACRALVESALTLFHDDGTGKEQSPTYAAFTIEMLSIACLAEPKLLVELAPTLAKAARHLQSLMDQNGRLPRIGDDDEGRVIPTFSQPPDDYVAAVVHAVAALTGRPELCPPSSKPSTLTGLFPEINPQSFVISPSIEFPSGGYTVWRRRASERGILMVMDHGPLGFPPLNAHGHGDALSLWMNVDGEPVFMDAGTGLYHAGGELREFLRSSSAHNTVTINNTSQSCTAGNFNWRHAATSWKISAGPNLLVAAHDGYKRQFGITCIRELKWAGDALIITDSFEGELSRIRTAEVNFLLGPHWDEIVSIDCDQANPAFREVPFSPRFSDVQSAKQITFHVKQPSSTITTAIRFLPK